MNFNSIGPSHVTSVQALNVRIALILLLLLSLNVAQRSINCFKIKKMDPAFAPVALAGSGVLCNFTF